MKKVKGIAHISIAPRPMGAMIHNPKVMGDHEKTGSKI